MAFPRYTSDQYSKRCNAWIRETNDNMHVRTGGIESSGYPLNDSTFVLFTGDRLKVKYLQELGLVQKMEWTYRYAENNYARVYRLELKRLTIAYQMTEQKTVESIERKLYRQISTISHIAYKAYRSQFSTDARENMHLYRVALRKLLRQKRYQYSHALIRMLLKLKRGLDFGADCHVHNFGFDEHNNVYAFDCPIFI